MAPADRWYVIAAMKTEFRKKLSERAEATLSAVAFAEEGEIEGALALVRTSVGASAPRARCWNRTVIGAGLTSALGDFSYETSNVILPGFLAVLGIPAAALGTIEGIADAVSSFAKMGAGVIADRLGVRKSLVVVGYALTALGQGVMALASGWWLVLFGRVVGWFGRGVRGPLRDAIVSEAITADTRGRAFGFHRAADTVGAVFGPLLGVGPELRVPREG